MKEILQRNIKTLKEISIDNHNPKRPEYMTESDFKAIDFDKVKEDYKEQLYTIINPKSADAIVYKDDQLTMIEFKNGIIGRGLIKSIEEKMVNSILMYCDITGQSPKDTREKMDFILVYNYDKNPFKPGKYHQNRYRDEFIKKLGSKAKLRFKQFGLNKYEGYIFRNVYTFSKEDFKKQFTDKLK